MAVPYTFASATSAIPLSQLDSNFATTITLGNTAIQLGNTVTTLNNMTFVNATVSSGNVTATTVTATTVTSPAATALTIQSAGTTAMTIDTSQNVGIGTSSPNAKLEVFKDGAPAASGNMNTGMVVAAASGSYAINIGANATGAYTWLNSAFQNNSGTAAPMVFMTGATERARIDSSGNLLVGTTSTTNNALFAVNGVVYMNNTVYVPGVYNLTTGSAANVHVSSDGTLYRSTSSIKYKRDVQDATHGLTEVMQLRPVKYKGKSSADGETVFGGLIAEEVHAAGLTEFVQYAEDGTPDALAYGNMVSLCIKAIQEQQALITQLTERISALEGKS